MINIPQWAVILIACITIVLVIVISLGLYIFFKNKYIITIAEMYNEKVEFLFKLPFNSKLKKLENYKSNHGKHDESYQVLKKRYDDFTNINVSNFLKRLDKLKKSTLIIKKDKKVETYLFKFPKTQIGEIDESFLNLMEKGIEIFEELDRITYFDELQKSIIGNVQESLTFFRDNYLSHKKNMIRFSKGFDIWLSEIDLQFTDYNDSVNNGTSNPKDIKENIVEIIKSINNFATSMQLISEGSTIIDRMIEPQISAIKQLTKEHNSVVSKNESEFAPYSKKYKETLRLFMNLNIKDASFEINGVINNMISSFWKFKTLFHRQIKTKQLVFELEKAIISFQREVNNKQEVLWEEALKIQKNKAEELKKHFLTLSIEKKKINLAYNDIERLFKRKNEDNFKVFFRTFNEEQKYHSLAGKYSELFAEIVEFISINLKTYSRFEKNVNTYNSLLVNIDINIKNHSIKLSDTIKKTLADEKKSFNNLIYIRDNNQLTLSLDLEEDINASIKKLDELNDFVSRWNKIAAILEITFVYLNRFKGEDEQMDKKIDSIRNRFESGKYRESLKDVEEIFKVYNLKG